MITVEDMNSYVQKYGLNLDYYELDTSLISSDGSDEYSDVIYDFVKVSHSISGNSHTYTFEIVNTGWTGGAYLLDANGDYIGEDDMTYNDDVLSYTSTNANLTLVLVLQSLKWGNSYPWEYQYVSQKLTTPNVSYGRNNHPTCYNYINLGDGSTGQIDARDWGMDNEWLFRFPQWCFVRFSEKYHYTIDLSDVTLTAGKLHEIPLTQDELTIEVNYLDKVEVIDVNTNPTLTIDLTGIYNIDNLDLAIKVFGNNKYIDETFNYELPVQAVQVTTFNELVTELATGASRIEVTNDLTFTADLNITSNVLIRGVTSESTPNKELDLDEYSIILNEGESFKLEQLILTNGNPAIIQRKDSKATLEKCTLTNNTNTDNNNLGSCICCDIDISSLDVVDDYTTIINNCSFFENHNCILHGGNLTITNSKYHNTDTSYVNINNPAFLFQVDGTANVCDSVFDITYDDDTFSTHNIMYGQALFMIGSTATINDMTADKIVEDDKVNWCNAPYNNASHLFAKYYYKAITSIVYSSPKHGFEDKNLAYCVSGTDWVFKANTQITKASDGTENRNTKIVWE